MSTQLPLDLGTFAQGATDYIDYYEEETTDRIVINIYLADYPESIPMIVDTGAPWCILSPSIFQDVANYAEPIHMLNTPLSIRGIRYNGWMYRLPMHFEAAIGEPQDVTATVFVPTLSPNEEWHHPNFIGLDGFLNRIRFAVDPASNLFYFGELM